MAILDDVQTSLTQLIGTSQKLDAAKAAVVAAQPAVDAANAELNAAQSALLTAQNGVQVVQQTHDSEVTALQALIIQL